MYKDPCSMTSPYPMYQTSNQIYNCEMNKLYYNIIPQLKPLIEYEIKEADEHNIEYAITESVLTAYLMGMGCCLERAHQIIESWEINDKFPFINM